MTVVRRLFLVRHAGTVATRHADVAVDEPLSAAGRHAAARLPALVPSWGHGSGDASCSPTARARETATAAGWDTTEDARLRPLDLGSWRAKTLADIGAVDPEGMAAWLSAPTARPHGGETIVELIDRVRQLLTDWHDPAAADLLAVTHAAVVRAAVVVAMDAPAESFWRVDAAPASVTELHTRGRGWVLVRSNATPS